MGSDELITIIREILATDLEKMPAPEPGPLWQINLWVMTRQAILDMDKHLEHNIGQSSIAAASQSTSNELS
ncbi:MAG TPA: hypothetical protein VE954_13625 [Oligoflexus sp.]|uniref:hypothetical protein n=1 Tax=Oligoflexus sp. TaxID=1971216 RepID=UPI002D53964C|nr:hypothetical protein [Oligoflexus sp.]HYX34139.1 hypothetical protein [Oligoflexus sp.]